MFVMMTDVKVSFDESLMVTAWNGTAYVCFVKQRLMLRTTKQEALSRYTVRPLIAMPSWVGMRIVSYPASTLLWSLP